MPKDPRIKKVLVIGSGPIIIGQAAEFDYSGTQACRALKSEGIETVLVNSNPATIMTDPDIADHVYIEPLTAEVVERIIEKEKPDAILPNLGGQMGLNLSMELARSGFLDRSGVRLLACKPDTIDRAEDRQLFKDTMEKLNQPCIPSKVVEDLDSAMAFADVIGYPVIVRPAFTMGGTGGGICENPEKLHEIATNGLRLSPIHQILVEKCIAGWKEIEYEVMRDHKGNVITVCNMENLDPVGVHTGDSIVVAPSQTLSDKEYQMLRTAALDIITELGIEGGCNCQFALKPDSFEYAVIEVNPRVSRSSALASKATGYPIAKVATKIALGYTLDEITNDVTGETCACFEPALDYVVVKYPKWPFDKFVYADKSLGTQMMATGEVMAIGNNFEHAMMKAVSSIELGMDTLTLSDFEKLTTEEVIEHLHVQDSERAFCVYEALKRGVPHQTIYDITKIDWWFLDKMQHLANLELGLKNGPLTREKYLEAKHYGFLDKTILRLSGAEKLPMDNYVCGFKMVDTCAAEFAAKTPYFYSTCDKENEAEQFIHAHKTGKKKILVFGSGPIRIGQGIEFDYCSVHAVWTLKKHGCEAILVNNNPETVSTDFDTGDRLYFDPLNPESVDHIIAAEKPDGCLVQFGGQTAIKLAKHMDEIGLPIYGTPADAIDEAEDRERFDELLERCAAYGAESDGVFDVTVAPVAQVWGITRGRVFIPDSEQIASRLALVDYRDILLDPETHSAMLRREGQAVDLGGIAKGFACGAADRIARENGVESGFISIGGNIMTIGQKPVADQAGRTVRQPFRFGLRDPRGGENDYIAAVVLADTTMATSGDYERYFMKDDVRYHHILDPATGYPARTDLMSVSVVSQDGAFADFMSTWLFIKGRSFVLERLNSFDCGLIVIDQDKNVYISENMRERVVPADKSGAYTFVSGGTA